VFFCVEPDEVSDLPRHRYLLILEKFIVVDRYFLGSPHSYLGKRSANEVIRRALELWRILLRPDLATIVLTL
jgi:hypothetical protein